MTNNSLDSKITTWLFEPLSADLSASLNRLAGSDDVQRVAVMPDVHLGKDVCNGTVIATSELVYPLAVGADIGCGMLAVSFDLEAEVLSRENAAGRLLGELYRKIPSIKHSRANCVKSLPASLTELSLSCSRLEKEAERDGLYQLGTLGRGNHFIEFQSDANGRLWLMMHSGSRGMGQAITSHHLRSTQVSPTGHAFIEAATSAGRSYISDVNWAIEYASQNRLAMVRAIESLMRSFFNASVGWSTLIHCHHNHVRREIHNGEDLWIHRKGALSAAEFEPGLIPGSMGTQSYHVSGRGNAIALQSSSHGAGRLMSRSVARRRISDRDLQRQLRGVWFDQRHTEELRDEAPEAYKDIRKVMRAQRDLTRIVRELRPILVYKGN